MQHAYQQNIKVRDNVLAFPGTQLIERPRGIASPRCIASPQDRMTFADVAREMCFDWHKRNCEIIGKLRSLHKHQAMPLPENPRFKSGVPCKGADNICAHSIWSRRKFMAWKERGVERIGISPAETRSIESRLGRNAAALAGAPA